MPKSGLQAMFGWLGGFGVDGENTDGNHVVWILADSATLPVATYRYPISKTADGTQQILYSPDMSSWTTRRITQRIVSENADRVVIEATAPSGTRGFFKVVGSGDTSGIMVSVQGGTLPQSSGLAGTAVATFQIGRTEVTWAEWQEVRSWAVNNGYTDLRVGAGSADDHPVWQISWYDALKWSNARSEMEGLGPVYKVAGSVYRNGDFGWSDASEVQVDTAANGYRLPTEAEWEWAARGGVNSQGYIYSGSNDVNAVAWYSGNSSGAVVALINGRGTWPVGQKMPNELGIHDMSGNQIEWVFDKSEYSIDRHLRGGAWNSLDYQTTVSSRYDYTRDPGGTGANIGFRVARNAP
jgi:formylglycine-generating enzyme required for sulfatase activity